MNAYYYDVLSLSWWLLLPRGVYLQWCEVRDQSWQWCRQQSSREGVHERQQGTRLRQQEPMRQTACSVCLYTQQRKRVMEREKKTKWYREKQCYEKTSRKKQIKQIEKQIEKQGERVISTPFQQCVWYLIFIPSMAKSIIFMASSKTVGSYRMRRKSGEPLGVPNMYTEGVWAGVSASSSSSSSSLPRPAWWKEPRKGCAVSRKALTCMKRCSHATGVEMVKFHFSA